MNLSFKRSPDNLTVDVVKRTARQAEVDDGKFHDQWPEETMMKKKMN